MKKLATILSLVLCVLLLSACDSKKISDAEIAYQNENFEEVILLLADIETEDSAVLHMLNVAKAHVAYNQNDYQKTIELISNIANPDDTLLEIHAISTAQLLFEDKQYLDVVSTLANLENPSCYAIYNESLNALITTAVPDFDTKLIVNLYALDSSIDSQVFELVIQQCNAYEYDYFLFVDDLISKLPSSDLKSKLETYLSNNGKIRVKAFMRGEWQLVYDDDDTAIVKVHVNDDDSKCIGILTQVSEFMTTYFYEENDLYWSDFIFDGDMPVSVSHLVRYTNGESYTKLCSFEIDFENNQILIHVTGVTKSDRIWEKVS